MTHPMQTGRRQLLACCLAACTAMAAGEEVRVVNHQDFPIRMPVLLSEGSHVLVDVGAKEAKLLPTDHNYFTAAPYGLAASDAGITVKWVGKPVGTISFAYVLADGDAATSWSPAQILDHSTPIPFSFSRLEGLVDQESKAEATTAGFTFAVDTKVFWDGFLDITTRVTNTAVDPKDKYFAIICKWEQPGVTSRTLCYDNGVQAFPDGASTRFRRPHPGQTGDMRHLQVQRGLDWVKSEIPQGAMKATDHSGLWCVWINDFAESFSVKRKLSAKSGAKSRWATANQAHYAQEAIARDGAVYFITEIARANIRTYRDRVVDNMLPAQGESAEFTSRIVFSDESVTDKRADEMFVGYTCYRTEKKTSSGIELTFGVPRVRFGTNYFPYSTLGENFDYKKLPGMDREGFWPLAADTVTEWKLFADDIKRDLRIAKAMGFELIRLHHLELLNPIEPKIRNEYLDFYFGELRHLGLKALIDAAWTPEEIAALVSKYRDLIDGVEIDNEVLIWGIDEGKPAEWNRIYDAVKAVAPDMPVHVTCHTNVGIFDKLAELGGKFDKIGSHAYQDSIDAIPSSRGFALAVGNYAAKVGKEPIITEWNWRNLTRLTEEERAPLIRNIFGNALVTRSIPTFYEFQFHETLCPNLRVGRGNILRHYELIRLSRRPKQDALELMELMRKYAGPEDVMTTPVVVELGSDGTGTGTLAIAANVKETERVKLVPETAAGCRLNLEKEIDLQPSAVTTLPFRLDTGTTQPGFYHAFVRLQKGDGTAAGYAWIEGRMTGALKLDLDSQTTVTYMGSVKEQLNQLDLSRPTVVVFGAESSVLEVETASLISETLESASGRVTPFIDETKLSHDKDPNLIIVGTPKSCKLLREVLPQPPAGSSYVAVAAGGGAGKRLVVGGSSPEDVEFAGVDFALRYWMHAKDSAARKIGLVEKVLPRKGPDPGALP